MLIRRASVVLLSILLSACASAEPPDPPSSPTGTSTPVTAFCPQCWEFLIQPTALDDHGACATCRMPVVELDTCSLTVYACSRTREWRRDPCGFDATQKCCREHPVTAAAVSPAENGVFTLRFCPGCRKFAGVKDWPAELSRCPHCDWVPLEASVVLRSWTWCRTEFRWRDGPCRKAAKEGCCTEKTGVLPACPTGERLPVSLFSPAAAREDLLVTTGWLQEHLEDPDLVIVHVDFGAGASDAKGRPWYGDNHVPGARLLHWDEIVVSRNGLPDEVPALESVIPVIRRLGIRSGDRIVLYDTGAGLESARAFMTLDCLGLADRAALLDGQWKKWRAEDRPVSVEVPEVAASEVNPQIRRAVVLPLGGLAILQWLAQQSAIGLALIDARSPAEYSGEQPGEGIRRPGHIPGAKSLCWSQNIESVENPVLRSEEELRDLYEQAGARPNRFLVVYCRTGVEAAHVYFTAKTLGYPVRLYDGSYAEWSAMEKLPVRRGTAAD